MADLFEQLVADYLTEDGYMTRLNVNYRKADGKQSGSDIDVLALHRRDHNVIVGDCKSWQDGFWADWMPTTIRPARCAREGTSRPYFKTFGPKGSP